MTNQARLFALSCLLASCALFACDVDADGLDDGLALDDEFRFVSPDPSSSFVHDVCPTLSEFNGVSTLIRYPEGTSCWLTLSDRPLVIVLPGAGFDYTSYAYLLDHLAANGFVAISVDLLATDNPAGHAAAAVTLEGVLDDMLGDWAFAGQIDPTNIAIVGHSRGGQTARYLADDLADIFDDWTVRAIVTLASKAGNDHPIVGNETEALLVLQGGDDADQSPDRGFMIYDGSSETLDKAMKLLEDGIHSHFSTEVVMSTQAHVTKGYVLAFLAEHLLDDATWYEDYIRGDEVPFGWPSRVASQFSDGTQRLVIDNFEDGDVNSPTIGGSVSWTLGASTSVLDLGAEPDIQHETQALRINGHFGGEYVEWAFLGTDVTDYAWLSLRVGHLNGALGGLSVRLRNNGVWQNTVSLSSYGTIEQPMEMCTQNSSAAPCVFFDVFAHMGTIRVPLSQLGAHDSVDGVRVVMGSKYPTTPFVLDSLEFAGSL